MTENKTVRYEPDYLLVARNMRTAGSNQDWVAMYLHEGFLYFLPVEGTKFNETRDKARENYRKKADITLGSRVHSPTINNWDIYNANDGWRMNFKYDASGTGRLEYTQPGKDKHDAQQDEVQTVGKPRFTGDYEDKRDMIQLPETITIDSLTALADALPKAEPIAQVQGVVVRDSKGNVVARMGSWDDNTTKDPLADQIALYPAYWKPLPANWKAIDTYRVDVLFPLNDSRLTHARKKLLVCGSRTGGKSTFKDVKEARDTLSQWLLENPEE